MNFQGCIRWAAGLFLSLHLGGAIAIDLSQHLSDLNYTCWSGREGAPALDNVMAQGSDGTLWLGSETGLFKFDGEHFQLFALPDGSHPIVGDVMAVYAGAGELWVGTLFGDVFVIKGNGLTRYDASQGLPRHAVWGFARRADGSMWAQTSVGLYHLEGSSWQRIGAEWGYPAQRGWAILVDKAGSLWSRTPEGTFRLDPHSHTFLQLAGPRGAGGPLFLAPDGNVWVADQEVGLLDLSDPLQKISGLQLGGTDPQAFGGVFDSDGALWTVIENNKHLLTVRIDDPRSFMATGDRSHVETIESNQAAKCNIRNRLALEDREGNIWRATITGIDRFRANKFHAVTQAAATFMQPVMTVDRAGVVWIMGWNFFLGLSAANRAPVSPGYRPDSNMMSLLREPDGSFLLATGFQEGLVHVMGDTGQSIALDPKVQASGLHWAERDSSGALWIASLNGGLYRQQGAAWVRNGGFEQLPQEPPFVLASDPRGPLWAGYVDGRLAAVSQQGVRVFGKQDGLDVGSIRAITLARGGDLWVGGEGGVTLFRTQKFHMLQAVDHDAFRGVSGIVQDGDGGLWMNGGAGVIHVAPTEMRSYAKNANYRVRTETFNDEDGLAGASQEMGPHPTAVLGGDGRVFFSTSQGAYWIDPRHIRRNSVAPTPIVQAVIADGRRYSGAESLQLPQLTRNFQIDFTAASLTMPERVRFRYFLDGVDSGWQEGGNQRQAAYTNVPPGAHKFHLRAFNEDGLGSSTDTAVSIDIPPAFYQTRWFYAACALLALTLLWRLVQLRLSYIASRLLERSKERERIARELHDTLIQSALGLLVTCQGVAMKLAQDDPARAPLEQALDVADRLLKDARERVVQLREAEYQGDLVAAIDTVGSEVFAGDLKRPSVTAKGKIRPLQAFAAEEIYWIAREALSNARQHAGASRVEVEIEYARDCLRLRIRDDGVGIAADVAAHGAGRMHLGIGGMRERAHLIGARFEMVSSAGAGVAVEVAVPAAAAYVRFKLRRFQPH